MSELTDTSRRRVLKTIGAGALGAAVLSGTASAHEDGFGYPGNQPDVADLPPVFPSWGSDGTDHWEMLDPAAPQDTNEQSHRPFYHIAPSGGDHSPHLFGLLDNVVDTPSNGGGTYSAVWHVHVVLDVNGDPLPGQPPSIPGGPATFENPTVSSVEEAIENDDDIFEVAFDFEFVCPVRPHRHK